VVALNLTLLISLATKHKNIDLKELKVLPTEQVGKRGLPPL
jgi:hypothetical protein